MMAFEDETNLLQCNHMNLFQYNPVGEGGMTPGTKCHQVIMTPDPHNQKCKLSVRSRWNNGDVISSMTICLRGEIVSNVSGRRRGANPTNEFNILKLSPSV